MGWNCRCQSPPANFGAVPQPVASPCQEFTILSATHQRVLEGMPRGSEDPPHCQSNLNRLKHWLDNGQGHGQATRAESAFAGLQQHNVIHERRTRAVDLIVSAVGLLGEAAATASNQRQNLGMTTFQLLRFANLAKRSGLSKKDPSGGIEPNGCSSYRSLFSPTNGTGER